jgi:regulator of nucleoside diphosphate kinase
LPIVAITFGHVVLGRSAGDLERLRAHEHAHVAQYERWGPLFLIAYPLASLLALLRTGRPYHDNCFEVAARAAARRPGEAPPGGWTYPGPSTILGALPTIRARLTGSRQWRRQRRPSAHGRTPPMTAKPPLMISSLDADRLDRMLQGLSADAFPGRPALEAELLRARVVEPQEVPADVVTMNSTVRFRFLHTGEAFTQTLVYPKDMDDSGAKISILAPVGTALLGLSQGDEIDWPKPGGGVVRVRIEEVAFQPERAGRYHR